MSDQQFKPTVAQATQAGFLPPRRSVPVVDVQQLCDGVFRMSIRDAYIASHAKSGQFMNLYSPDPLKISPRPFGVSQIEGDVVSIIFAVVGKGTQEFSRMRAGDSVDVLGPLGKPFDIEKAAHYVLVGGGLGIPPLIEAAQAVSQGDASKTTAVFGYRNVHFGDEFVAQYADAVYSIDETEGNVLTLLERLESSGDFDDTSLEPVILSCGPTPMLKAIAAWASKRGIPCQLSLEERMGCGFGTCVVCVVDTQSGRQKVCVDGPVFTPEQLGWDK